MIVMNECITYSLNKAFPDERYISSVDMVTARLTPNSFEVIITLSDSTSKERKAIACGEISVSLFVHKQIPHIILNYGVYACDFTINIQKLRQASIDQWILSEEETIQIFLLEENTGNILNMRFAKFPLMTELKYLTRLQMSLSKEEIDHRIAEATNLYTTKEMAEYAIFFGEIPSTTTLYVDIPLDEDIIF